MYFDLPILRRYNLWVLSVAGRSTVYSSDNWLTFFFVLFSTAIAGAARGLILGWASLCGISLGAAQRWSHEGMEKGTDVGYVSASMCKGLAMLVFYF